MTLRDDLESVEQHAAKYRKAAEKYEKYLK
jgi:hypothetical protein